MTWINLHLVDGIPRPTTVDAVETELLRTQHRLRRRMGSRAGATPYRHP